MSLFGAHRPFWWPDARGWAGIGVFNLSVLLVVLMFVNKEFRDNEFVRTIATLVIGTGFVGGVVAFFFSATKTGVELADQNAALVKKAAEHSPPIAPEPEGKPE